MERLKADKAASRPHVHTHVDEPTPTEDHRSFDEWVADEVAAASPCTECGAAMVRDPFGLDEEWESFDGEFGQTAGLVCSAVLAAEEAAGGDFWRDEIHPESSGEREIERIVARWQ